MTARICFQNTTFRVQKLSEWGKFSGLRLIQDWRRYTSIGKDVKKKMSAKLCFNICFCQVYSDNNMTRKKQQHSCNLFKLVDFDFLNMPPSKGCKTGMALFSYFS